MNENTSTHVRVGSLLATVGIFGVAIVTAIMNFHFWYSRGDLTAALLTLGAEAVAVGGFVMVLHHWRDRKATALGAGLVTLLAAGWGGLTMSEKLGEEAHGRNVEAAKTSTVFVQAERNLEVAQSLYAAALSERVPEGLGPLTTQARSLDLQRRAERLEAAVSDARERVDALTPEPPAFDAKSAARGWGAMLAVLLGLSVFGFRSKTKDLEAEQPKTNEEPTEIEAPAPIPLTASELGKLGAEAKRRKREEAEQRRLERNRYQREWRAKKAGKFPVDYFGEAENRPM